MTILSKAQLADPRLVAGAARHRDLYGFHQEIWKFWSNDAEASRDFLYRYEMVGDAPRYYIVSQRAPRMDVPGWSVQSRPYAPSLERGARLCFSLRANPTKRVAKPGERSDGKRHDVVMAKKRELAGRGDVVHMPTLVQESGTTWLQKQGERHGFHIDPNEVRADGYRSHRFVRPKGGSEVAISGIEFQGTLRVTEPVAFSEALRKGIGPAKGFGFGLMLVRRA